MKTLSIILLALVCAGCQPRTGEPDAAANNPVVYRDAETGCEYLSTGQVNALTPRIDSDGLTHRGCRKTDRVSP